MADQEEDLSALPLIDRFVHKNWKVRKEAYEAAAKEFDNAQTESDPSVRQFTQDPNLWKGAVTDSNVAAHQEALNALCSFLQICGTQGCTRSRNITLTPLAEKGLISTKPAAKQKATEAILLYIELDKADPVLEELLPVLSHKLPKIVAATLAAFTTIYHQYGTKTVNPKPVLQVLPKVYGHADKNVRAEAQNLTVELYRWLRESMKPLFWNELKPVQQQDLDKLFEKVKEEPQPKSERLLRSQQRAAAEAALSGQGNQAGVEAEEDEVEEEPEPQLLAVDVFPSIPKDFSDRVGSSKWKDRKEALEDLHKAVDAPAIEEGPFDDIIRALAKCMKDANIGVVTEAAICTELLAKGLRRGFAKYRSSILGPIMERLKERKQTVTDALAGALDAIFMATSLQECLEEALSGFTHKNPLVKLEATRFLIRALKTTREAPSIPEVKQISDTTSKLLTDSQETQRNAAAEVLGTLLKIMGERIMNVHFEGLDDIRKAKIKEYADSVEVKAKYKPKAAPAPKQAAASATAASSGQKRPLTKKPTASGQTVKKAAPPALAQAVDETPATPQPKALSRPASAMPRPGASAPRGLKPPTAIGGAKKLSQPSVASPKRSTFAPAVDVEEEEDPIPPPRVSRGLTARTLAKPAQQPLHDHAEQQMTQPASMSMTSVEKHELEELRIEVTRLRSSNEALRTEHSRLNSQVNELQNQNAQLIEDHTRDVLSIKAKETQLVRARSDAETEEQKVLTLQREVDRLKRELSRIGRANSPRPVDYGGDPLQEASAASLNGAQPSDLLAKRRTVASPTGGYYDAPQRPSSRSTSGSPIRSSYNRIGGSGPAPSYHAPTPNSNGVLSDSDGRSSNGSVGGGAYNSFRRDGESAPNGTAPASASSSSVTGGTGVESWRRAAEVTQSLKARIEMMKARQGISRG